MKTRAFPQLSRRVGTSGEEGLRKAGCQSDQQSQGELLA